MDLANSSVPIILSLSPFADKENYLPNRTKTTEQRINIPCIDKTTQPHLRCHICRTYVNSRTTVNILNGTFFCPFCLENTVMPASYLNNVSKDDQKYGLGTEMSCGTYEMVVGGILNQVFTLFSLI